MIIPVLDITKPRIWPRHTLEACQMEGAEMLNSSAGRITKQEVTDNLLAISGELARRRTLPAKEQY